MSKLLGPFKMTGRIDGITFYQRGNSIIGRSSRGVSSSKLKTADCFERTRENNNEFKHASVLSKLIRAEIFKYNTQAYDTYTHSRLNGAMLAVIKKDNLNMRGKRNFTNGLANPAVLQKFTETQLNKEAEIDQLINGEWNYTGINNKVKLNILNPKKDIAFPAKNTVATIQRMQLLLNEFSLEITSTGTGIQVLLPQITPLKIELNSPTLPISFKGIVIDIIEFHFVQKINGTEYQLNARNLNSVKILGITIV